MYFLGRPPSPQDPHPSRQKPVPHISALSIPQDPKYLRIESIPQSTGMPVITAVRGAEIGRLQSKPIQA
jgi:hypothetical protein